MSRHSFNAASLVAVLIVGGLAVYSVSRQVSDASVSYTTVNGQKVPKASVIAYVHTEGFTLSASAKKADIVKVADLTVNGTTAEGKKLSIITTIHNYNGRSGSAPVDYKDDPRASIPLPTGVYTFELKNINPSYTIKGGTDNPIKNKVATAGTESNIIFTLVQAVPTSVQPPVPAVAGSLNVNASIIGNPVKPTAEKFADVVATSATGKIYNGSLVFNTSADQGTMKLDLPAVETGTYKVELKNYNSAAYRLVGSNLNTNPRQNVTIEISKTAYVSFAFEQIQLPDNANQPR